MPGMSTQSFLTVVSLSFLVACGGSDGLTDEEVQEQIENFVACGGDIEGTWNVGSFIATLDASGLCAEAEASVSGTASGTITFDSDMTYSLNVTQNVTLSVTLPASCFEGAESCSDLDAEVDGTCTGDAAVSCDCVVTQESEGTETGEWSTSEGLLTQTPDGEAEEEPSRYCVDGSQLQVVVGDSEGGLSAIFTATK